MKSPDKKVWGLTGGIASGKSTVAKIFSALGAEVIDADQISRELSAPSGKAHAAILTRFGTSDRAVLRQIVFNDPRARADLEAILHPLIQAESAFRISESKAEVVIYEAALLIEANRAQNFDGLIVVLASPETRMNRLTARDSVSELLALKMIGAQITEAEREAAATHVIRNEGSLADLETQVRDFLKKLGLTSV